MAVERALSLRAEEILDEILDNGDAKGSDEHKHGCRKQGCEVDDGEGRRPRQNAGLPGPVQGRQHDQRGRYQREPAEPAPAPAAHTGLG